jgi:hypothetical protein
MATRKPQFAPSQTNSTSPMKAIKIVLGGICGAFVGFALGIFAAVGLGLWSQWTHPDDPSAGSVAIVVIATAPLGAVLGALLGGLTIAKRPRLFLLTFLPLAILFVVLQVTLSTLRGMDRPRHFVLEVRGTAGARYVGAVLVDGEVKDLKGTIPTTLEFDAFQVELAVALVSQDSDRKIAIETSASGRDLKTGIESQTGIHQTLESFGYSETFGGTSNNWSRMSPEEVDALIKDHKMPRRLW